MEELLKLIKDMVAEDLKKPIGGPISKEEYKDKVTELLNRLSTIENVDMSKPVGDMLNACAAKGDVLGIGICLKVTLDGVKAHLAMGDSDLLDILMLVNTANVKSKLKEDIKNAFDEIYKVIETTIDNIRGGY